MTQRLSKLAEYLYDENFEMAVNLHRQNQRVLLDNEEQYLLLAKAYFVGEDYEKAIDILGKINAFDTNIVLQHPNLKEADRYDLVIGTNIFLYYNSFEQALAMKNLNEMLKNDSILLSNNALIEFPFTPIHSIGYSKAIYSKKQGDADAIIWYQKK